MCGMCIGGRIMWGGGGPMWGMKCGGGQGGCIGGPGCHPSGGPSAQEHRDEVDL